VEEILFDRRLVVEDELDEEREEDEVANDSEGEVGDGALVEGGEGKCADGEEEEIGEEERDADRDE